MEVKKIIPPKKGPSNWLMSSGFHSHAVLLLHLAWHNFPLPTDKHGLKSFRLGLARHHHRGEVLEREDRSVQMVNCCRTNACKSRQQNPVVVAKEQSYMGLHRKPFPGQPELCPGIKLHQSQLWHTWICTH